MNPWRAMWTRPRETIREVVSSGPNRSIWLLSSIYGFSSLLNVFQSMALGHRLGLVPMTIAAVVLAPVWGFAIFSIWSWVTTAIGKLLKGVGEFRPVRAAYAWSCVPLIAIIPIWALLIVFYGDLLFFDIPESQILEMGQAGFLFALLLGKLVFSIWSLVLYVQALAEVQQFSILKAILNMVAAGLLLGLLFGLFWGIAADLLNGWLARPATMIQL